MRNNTKTDTLKVLLDIAQGLKILQSDPKALEDEIKNANSLDESEKAKLIEDRAFMATVDDERAKLKQQQSQLADITAESIALDEKRKVIATEAAQVDADKRSLAFKQAECVKLSEVLNNKSTVLNELEAKLKSEQLAQNERGIALSKAEADLKAKAAKVNALLS